MPVDGVPDSGRQHGCNQSAIGDLGAPVAAHGSNPSAIGDVGAPPAADSALAVPVPAAPPTPPAEAVFDDEVVIAIPKSIVMLDTATRSSFTPAMKARYVEEWLRSTPTDRGALMMRLAGWCPKLWEAVHQEIFVKREIEKKELKRLRKVALKEAQDREVEREQHERHDKRARRQVGARVLAAATPSDVDHIVRSVMADRLAAPR